jgi:NADH:ubiquinone oxidoreductase subunit K
MIEFKTMLVLSALLFSLGIFSVLSKKNAVSILIGVELILNASALNFVTFSKFNIMRAGILDVTGFIFSVFIIVLAAAEAVVALGIFIAIFKFLKNIDVEKADLMRW